jgi:hypothetical protein
MLNLIFASWNTTYESLLGSNKPFSQPIPLAVRLLNHAIQDLMLNKPHIFPTTEFPLRYNVSFWYLEIRTLFAGNGRLACGRLGAGRPIQLGRDGAFI